jgi:hypothetical protein
MGDYLAKPFRIAELEYAVHCWIDARHAVPKVG